eukprot:gene12644-12772_t
MTAFEDTPFGSVAFSDEDIEHGEPASILESPFVSGQVDAEDLLHQLPAAVADVAKRVQDQLRTGQELSPADGSRLCSVTSQKGASSSLGNTLCSSSTTSATSGIVFVRANTAGVADILESPFASADVADVMQQVAKAEAQAQAEAAKAARTTGG